MTMQRTTLLLVAAAMACGFTTRAAAQNPTVNFSSLEVLLAEPDRMDLHKLALWAGWATQQYEYNMPFIEITNPSDAPSAITSFEMSIGDTAFQFSNQFLRKEDTNAGAFPANGTDYAFTGYSTPDIEFDTSVDEDGDLLVIDFTDGGLMPGETVRFQVDINRDPDEPNEKLFADYTSVFFKSDGSDDTSENSEIVITFEGGDEWRGTLPNQDIDGSITQFFQRARPYSVPQQGVMVGPIPIVPEPAAGLLAALGVATIGARSKRRR
ncbi:hypothetical protein [Botrimarina sp.]|uniref:hypothetical protein n=1 Tax=Botrimarina sp. TaxID=2795802 RepID=UPI0032EAB14E